MTLSRDDLPVLQARKKHSFLSPTDSDCRLGNEGKPMSGHEIQLHMCRSLPLPPVAQCSRMALGSRLLLASPLEGREPGEPWDCA